MRRESSNGLVAALLVLCCFCGACSAADAAAPGQKQNGEAAGGAGGSSDAVAGTDGDFGSSTGNAGTGALPAPSDAGRDLNAMCDPGTYKGTYKCTLEMNGMMTLPLEGEVSFDLQIDETTQETCGEEFCSDLVIAEGSGKLFGFALLIIGFETQLEGGLDCKTGAFKASAADGIWGIPTSSNPADPNAPLTVAKPPSGMFDGTLEGLHLGGAPQTIEGTWALKERSSMLNCPGPFKVERQP